MQSTNNIRATAVGTPTSVFTVQSLATYSKKKKLAVWTGLYRAGRSSQRTRTWLAVTEIHALHREENIVPLSQLPKCKWRSLAKKFWILGQNKRNRRADMATSWKQRNLRSRWRVRQYKDADVRTPKTASAPSAHEFARFYTGFRQSAHPEAFSKCVSFTQRRVNLWKRTLFHAISSI